MRINLLLIPVFLCLTILLFGCTKKDYTVLINKEIATVNWTDVDKFPLFEVCDENANRKQQQLCFEKEFHKHLSAYLHGQKWRPTSETPSIISVFFIIDRNGKIDSVEVKSHDAHPRLTRQTEGLVKEGLKQLPNIEPAIKRANKVNCRFELPLRIAFNLE